jgi:choloylglycine hydrolase
VLIYNEFSSCVSNNQTDMSTQTAQVNRWFTTSRRGTPNVIAAMSCLAALIFLSSESCPACSFVDVEAQDGTVVIGRSIEWGFPMKYTFSVVPRGRSFSGSFPADKVAAGFKAMTWTNRFAYAGIGVTVQQGLDSAQNEAGLNIEGLNLPGFTEFQPVTPNDRSIVEVSQLSDWVMGNFATVREVQDALPRCTVWTPPVSSQGSSTLHFAITDRSGAGIVVEFVKGGVQIHTNVTHTLANSPPYDWHLANLRNYITLSSKDTTEVTRQGRTLQQLSTGDGLTGLPGDFKSASRFTKLSIMRSFAAPVPTAAEAYALAGHIINTVDIPRGAVDSGVFEGKPMLETAQIVLVKDLTNNKVLVADYAHRLNFVLINLDELFTSNQAVGAVPVASFIDQKPVDVTGKLKAP